MLIWLIPVASYCETALVFPLVSVDVSSAFGARRHPVYDTIRHHDGVDLRAPAGTTVRSLFSGVVIFAGEYAGYGNIVVVAHKRGLTSHYAHLLSISVAVGQPVVSGEVLGQVGETGTATGPHLHLEIRRNGTPVDPLEILPSLLVVGEG